MEVLGEDQALQAVFGRASDLHGIENEAIDFTQLEDYLNSDTENFNFETFANGSGEDHDHHQHHQHHSHGHCHNQNQNQSHGKIPNSTLPQSNHCNKARQHGEERHLANSHHGEQRHLQQNQHGEERHLPQSQHGEERHLPHSQHSEERHLPHSQHGEERHLPHTEHAEERHLVHTQQHTPDRLSDYSDAMSFKNSVHYAKGSLPESPPESEPYSPPENNGKQSTISSISSTVPPANYSQPSLYEHMKQIFNNGSLNNVPSSQLSPPHSTQQPSPQHSAGLHSPPQTQQPQQQQTQPTHSSPVHNNLQADSVTTSSPSHAQQATQGVGGQPATAQQLLHYMKTTNQLNAAALQQHLHNVIARSTPVMTAPAPLPPPHLNNQSPTASAAVTATTSPQHLASAAGTQTMGFLPICGSPAHTLPVLAPPGVPLAGCAIAAASSSSSLSPQHVAAGGAGGGGVAKQLPPNFGVMNNLQNQPAKKRKYESPNNTVNEKNANSLLNGLLQNIKQEPGTQPSIAIVPDVGILPDMSPLGQPSPDTDDSMFDMYDNGDAVYADGSYQCIKFQPFQPPKWHTLYDASCKELPGPTYRIDADKGFNFSVSDDAFVCQKKNHFQVTSHVGLNGDPKIVKTPDGYKKIDSWQLHFYGVKMKRSQNMDSMTQTIKVEQSQSDRSKRAFHPVPLQLQPGQLSKVTVGRLHFSETTSNNMRKKGKPNPDQRFFLLVVSLNCHCGSSNYQIVAQASERIIVRASNPGQFESDVDVNWQKGSNQDSIWHSGRVGVNTDRPDESLVVHGNLKVTGQVVQPSDMRVKRDIQELDSKNQLQNVTRMKLYKYKYTESFGKVAG
ncbi:PREDICTED: myelin regulatory factor-like, partial [Priapulus caudatus]|uniref:Myelin regulatory factor-like n=1 Tax=Priapulus caudatus TaxID=37621 RepID=A0ABM1DQ41_PRICU